MRMLRRSTAGRMELQGNEQFTMGGAATRLYAGGTAGGDCHQRNSGGAVVARDSIGPRSGPAATVLEQLSADRYCDSQFPQLEKGTPTEPHQHERRIDLGGRDPALHGRDNSRPVCRRNQKLSGPSSAVARNANSILFVSLA